MFGSSSPTRIVRLAAIITASSLAVVAGQAAAQSTTPTTNTPPPSAPQVSKEDQSATKAALIRAQTHAGLIADFALKAAPVADKEGKLAIGSLLRGLARSQRVHENLMKQQADAIVLPAGTTPAAVEKPAVPELKTTAENLAALGKWVDLLRETEFPAMRRTAESQGNREAVRVIRWAREASIEWSRLLKDFAEPKESVAAKMPVYVSRTCGFVVLKLDMQRCAICRQDRDDFEKVE
jgi:rubrerythrin